MFFNFLKFIFLDSAFPAVFILFIFALISYKQIKPDEALRFIIIFSIITFSIRLMQYIILPYNARYLYTLTFFFIIFSVTGFPLLVFILNKLMPKKIPAIAINHVKIFLMLIIGVSCIGKALSSPDHKSYIKEIAQIIKKAERKAVLIFDDARDGVRSAYHAGVEYFPFESILDKDLKNMGYALNIIELKGIKTFVLVKKSDKDFRKFFEERKIKFPLKLIKELKEKHICFSLYEYDVIYYNKLTD